MPQTGIILLILAIITGIAFYFASRGNVEPAPPGPEPPTPGIGTELVVTAPSSVKSGGAVTIVAKITNKLDNTIYATAVGKSPLSFGDVERTMVPGSTNFWSCTFTMPNADVNYVVESWFEGGEYEWHKDAVATGVIVALEPAPPPEPPPGPPQPSKLLLDLQADLWISIWNVNHGNANVEDTFVRLGNLTLTYSQAIPKLRQAMIEEAVAIGLITQAQAAGIYWDFTHIYLADGTKVI